MTTENRDRRLPAVQALRGIAASLVVFHHFARLLQDGGRNPSWINASGLGNLGMCGVDIFFVISGFIMVYTTRGKAGADDAKIFITRRFLRIYPLYWVWTSLLLVLWVVGFAQQRFHYSALYLVKSYLLIPSFNGLNFQPLMRQGWTLSFEMLFYLIFSLGILLKLRSRKLLFLVLAFSTLALLGRLFAPDGGARHLLTDPIVMEFLYGVLAAEILMRLPAIGNSRLARSLPIVLMSLGAIALLSTVKVHDADSMRFAFYGVPAFCIVFGGAIWGSAYAPSLLIYLGDCSYSIYLVHFFFSLAYASTLKHILSLNRLPSDAVIVLAGTITIAVSSLTYFLVELPLTKALAPRGAKKIVAPAPAKPNSPMESLGTIPVVMNRPEYRQ